MVRRPLSLGLTNTTLWANKPWSDHRKTMQATTAILLIDQALLFFLLSNKHKLPAFHSRLHCLRKFRTKDPASISIVGNVFEIVALY
jgi:hypothetical protein